MYESAKLISYLHWTMQITAPKQAQEVLSTCSLFNLIITQLQQLDSKFSSVLWFLIIFFSFINRLTIALKCGFSAIFRVYSICIKRKKVSWPLASKTHLFSKTSTFNCLKWEIFTAKSIHKYLLKMWLIIQIPQLQM